MPHPRTLRKGRCLVFHENAKERKGLGTRGADAPRRTENRERRTERPYGATNEVAVKGQASKPPNFQASNCASSRRAPARPKSASICAICVPYAAAFAISKNVTETQGMGIGREAQRAERSRFAFQSANQPGAPIERPCFRGKTTKRRGDRAFWSARGVPQTLEVPVWEKMYL